MASNYSQNKETIYLWPDRIPTEKKYSERIIRTEEKSGVITKIVAVEFPSFTVYKPQIEGNGIGIIVCPGGGYNILAIDLEGNEVAQWLTKLGYTVFVLKYSVPNKQKDALNDLKRTISIVRNHANKYNLNQSKIGILGFSAGASLCARASTLYNEESYIKFDESDNVSARPDFSLLIYPAYLDNGENKTITPELNINKRTPPMFVFGTADDDYGNSCLVITKALREEKVPVELHFLAEGGHGYGLRKGNIAAESWTLFAENWLKRIDLK